MYFLMFLMIIKKTVFRKYDVLLFCLCESLSLWVSSARSAFGISIQVELCIVKALIN